MYTLDLHRLNVFRTVVNEGSLSKASGRLYMSQPAISGHMKALEQQLGLPLFRRVGRRSVVNRAGEVLYKKAEELFWLAEEIKVEMEDLRGVSNGQLALGVSVDWQYRVSRGLNRFKQEYPGVGLSMAVANSERIEKLVLDRGLDMGLVGRASSRAELASEHLAHDELVPICNSTHRFAAMTSIDIGELADERFIVREAGSTARRLTDELLSAHNLDWNVSMELGSHESIKGAVIAGKGIGMVPIQALEAELRAGLLAIADIPKLKSPMRLHLIYHRRKKMTATQTAFIETISSNGALWGDG